MKTWIPFRQFLVKRGMVITSQTILDKNPNALGYILMVNKEQFKSILSPGFLINMGLSAELALLKLKVQKKILELFNYDSSPGSKAILNDCSITSEGYYKFDNDTYFIPVLYYGENN